ncbi:hypothetical protein ATJ97_2692 [Georgenia soli]|uniref:Uncharacterized protein n=1 Tax=Georgenia soli TaxID=638953 RepID=A0A2A9ENQ9_9MICO|nr:hypothetical protein ATJ97_2692 [Georgenia soli]
MAGCSADGAEDPLPIVTDDPEGLLTVAASPALRDALETIDRMWTAEGNRPLRVDFGPADMNRGNHLAAAMPAAMPEPIASDVVLTENPRTVDSADAPLWTDHGVVATTELVLVVPSDHPLGDTGHELGENPDKAEQVLPELFQGRVALCGSYCGELADEWISTAESVDSSRITLLPACEDDVADHRGRVQAKDFADLPPSSGQRAVLAVADGEEAAAFVDFLREGPGADVLAELGFEVR